MIGPTEVVSIWDATSGKVRSVRNLRVVLYDNGSVVEFVVVGAHREWPMFIPLAKFKETNPSVVVQE